MSTPKTIMHLLLCFAAAVFFTCSSCTSKTEEQHATTVDTAMTEMDDDGDSDESENPISEFREALAALPAKDRIETFNGMTPGFRATIWRNRISDALESDLTQPQKDVLLKAIEHIVPEAYTKEGQKAYMDFYKDFKPMAMEAFKDDTVKLLNIVTRLDKPSDSTTLDEEEKKLKNCNCNVSDDWCAINFDCKPRSCKATNSGCGWFGLNSCDGLCIYAP